jgi:hypothetical protein
MPREILGFVVKPALGSGLCGDAVRVYPRSVTTNWGNLNKYLKLSPRRSCFQTCFAQKFDLHFREQKLIFPFLGIVAEAKSRRHHGFAR